MTHSILPRAPRCSARRRAHWGQCMVAGLIMLVMLAGAGALPAPRTAAAPVTSAEALPSAPPSTTLNAQPASTGTAIFSDDFEAYGDDSLWDATFSFPVQSDIIANGSFAARLINGGGNPVFGRKSLDETYPRLFMRVRFFATTIGSASTTLVNLRSSSTTSIVAIRIDATGHLSYLTGATGITSTSTVPLSSGEWHELQVLVDTTEEATTNLRIWVDSAELTSLRQSVWLGTESIRIIDLGDNSAGQSSDIAYDDIIIDDEFIAADRSADPVPGTLRVRTFPAWSNIGFELEGNTFYSDENGNALIKVERWSTDLRSRITVRESIGLGGARAIFTGWRGWHSAHSVDVYAAFSISEYVQFFFQDLSGAPIDASMIDSMTIKSKSGVIETLTGDELSSPVLINTSSVAPGATGIRSKSTEYVVDQVIINGTNVVHRARQRSSFEEDKTWTISLLFYSVTFSAMDAFFGTSLGTELVVRAPDGTEQRIPLDENGQATIARLPRGEYTVAVLGGGYSPPRPIYVSRDQVVEMQVVSQLDIALVLGVICTFVGGLIIAGRPFLVTRPFRFALRYARQVNLPALRGGS